MALVKGICKNFGECDLADNKEVQEVEKTNFVCEECGKPLHPVDGGTKTTGNGGGKGPNKKLFGIIGGAAAALAVIGGGIYALTSGGKDGGGEEGTPKVQLALNHTSKTMKVGESYTLVATITPEGTQATLVWEAINNPNAVAVADGIVTAKEEGESKVQVQAIVGTDTLSTICTYSVEKQEKTTPPGGEGGGTPVPPVNPPYGKYTGDRNSQGQPHGFGDLEFTKHKLVTGEIYAEPGYIIRNGRFVNGKLQSGTLYDTDGNKVCFVDANNNL